MATLQEIIEEFGTLNEQIKKNKKITDDLNKEIKDQMRSMTDHEVETDNFVATFQVIKSENFNEDKLIEWFTKMEEFARINAEYEIIKTKLYADMNAIENAIYDNRLDPKLLAQFKESTQTERLTVSVKKEKKKRGDKN